MASTKAQRTSTPVGTLSESLEDYLEIVLQLQQEKRVARVRDIAARKKVSNASVSNALSRLAREGYVHHEAHEFVRLTERGEELAARLLRRHTFLVSFLRDVLQVSAEIAENDACAIEHHVSTETLERLASFHQFVRSCPKAGPGLLDVFATCRASAKASAPDLPDKCVGCAYADPRSRKSKSEVSGGPALVPLSSLHPGERGVVVRLAARSPVRERLADAGLLPDVQVEMTRINPGSKQVRVSVQGSSMDLEPRDASAILVRREPSEE